MKPTKVQRTALDYALRDGALQVGGQDGRPIRRDVWERCLEHGWLKLTHPPIPYKEYWEFSLTEKGRTALCGS